MPCTTWRPNRACGLSWDDPVGTFTVNAMGTLNLCSAAAKSGRRPRVLIISSAEVYGKVPAAGHTHRRGPAIGPRHPLRGQ